MTVPIVINRDMDRAITATVTPTIHDGFEKAAKARGLTKSGLVRLAVTAIARDPSIVERLVEGALNTPA